MPRLIDYVGRFEFIRQAAFAVVRDEGVEALSRRRVAQELGTGVNTIRRSVAGWADLARLAADQVESRRRLGRLGRRTDDPIEAAALVVRSLMPEDESHLDEELVWLKLVAACALRPSGHEPPGQLRREFAVAQRGYDDRSADLTSAGPFDRGWTDRTGSDGYEGDGGRADGTGADGYEGDGGRADGTDVDGYEGDGERANGTGADGHRRDGHRTEGSRTDRSQTAASGRDDARAESRGAALASYVARREQDLASAVGQVLDLIGVHEPRADAAATVIALIEGLTLSACLGRLTPEHATRLAIDQVTRLRPVAGRPSGPAG